MAFGDYVAERRHRLAVPALNARVQHRLLVDFSSEFAPGRREVSQLVAENALFGPLLGTQTRGAETADTAVLEPVHRRRLETLLYGR